MKFYKITLISFFCFVFLQKNHADQRNVSYLAPLGIKDQVKTSDTFFIEDILGLNVNKDYIGKINLTKSVFLLESCAKNILQLFENTSGENVHFRKKMQSLISTLERVPDPSEKIHNNTEHHKQIKSFLANCPNYLTIESKIPDILEAVNITSYLGDNSNKISIVYDINDKYKKIIQILSFHEIASYSMIKKALYKLRSYIRMLEICSDFKQWHLGIAIIHQPEFEALSREMHSLPESIYYAMDLIKKTMLSLSLSSDSYIKRDLLVQLSA